MHTTVLCGSEMRPQGTASSSRGAENGNNEGRSDRSDFLPHHSAHNSPKKKEFDGEEQQKSQANVERAAMPDGNRPRKLSSTEKDAEKGSSDNKAKPPPQFASASWAVQNFSASVITVSGEDDKRSVISTEQGNDQRARPANSQQHPMFNEAGLICYQQQQPEEHQQQHLFVGGEHVAGNNGPVRNRLGQERTRVEVGSSTRGRHSHGTHLVKEQRADTRKRHVSRIWTLEQQNQQQRFVGDCEGFPKTGRQNRRGRSYRSYYQKWEPACAYSQPSGLLVNASFFQPIALAPTSSLQSRAQWRAPQFVTALQQQEHQNKQEHQKQLILNSRNHTAGAVPASRYAWEEEKTDSKSLGFFDPTGLWIPHGMKGFHDKRKEQIEIKSAIRSQQRLPTYLTAPVQELVFLTAPSVAAASPIPEPASATRADAQKKKEDETAPALQTLIASDFQTILPPPGFEALALRWAKGQTRTTGSRRFAGSALYATHTSCLSASRHLHIFSDEFEGLDLRGSCDLYVQYAKGLWKRLSGKLRHKLVVMREQRKQRAQKYQRQHQHEHQQPQANANSPQSEEPNTNLLRSSTEDDPPLIQGIAADRASATIHPSFENAPFSGGWPQLNSIISQEPPVIAVTAPRRGDGGGNTSNGVAGQTARPTFPNMTLGELYEAMHSSWRPQRQDLERGHAAVDSFQLRQWQYAHQQRVLLSYLGGTNHKTYGALVAAHSTILELTKDEVQYAHVIYYGCLVEQQFKQHIADLLKRHHGLSRTPISGSPQMHSLRGIQYEYRDERCNEMKQHLQDELKRLQVIHQNHRQQLQFRRDHLLRILMGENCLSQPS